MNLTRALVKSVNTIPVRLGMLMGRKKIVDMAHLMGIESPLLANPSMPLGSNDVTVMEMTSAYGVFMSGGFQTGRHGIVQISRFCRQDFVYSTKRLIQSQKKSSATRAIAALNLMLSQVPEWGTGRRSALDGIKSAGKTGTTSAYKDAWFVGLHRQLCFGSMVWQ